MVSSGCRERANEIAVTAANFRLPTATRAGIGNEVGRQVTSIPGAKTHLIRVDSARLETISYLRQHGYPHIAWMTKWPNSVEEGIRFLRRVAVIVSHTQCIRAQQEAQIYSSKVDRSDR
jgi:phage terminase large subunit